MAMTAIKTSLASMGNAGKIGYRYGRTKDDWTSERIDKELSVCDTALGILRGMDERGELGSKGIEVENDLLWNGKFFTLQGIYVSLTSSRAGRSTSLWTLE
jgi:hypothetical protein